MRCQDDINTEHNMKSIGRAAVAQRTKRQTRKGQTRVQIREAHIFNIYIGIIQLGALFCLLHCTFFEVQFKNYLNILLQKFEKEQTEH